MSDDNVTAESGFYWLTLIHRDVMCDNRDLIARMPVVAWRIDSAGAHPVLPDTRGHSYDTRPRAREPALDAGALLCPDGAVLAGGKNFEDELAWLSWVREEERRAIARLRRVPDPTTNGAKDMGLVDEYAPSFAPFTPRHGVRESAM